MIKFLKKHYIRIISIILLITAAILLWQLQGWI